MSLFTGPFTLIPACMNLASPPLELSGNIMHAILPDKEFLAIFGLTQRECDIIFNLCWEGRSLENIARDYQLSADTVKRIYILAAGKLIKGIKATIEKREEWILLRKVNETLREENHLLKERLEALTAPEKRKFTEVELLRSPVSVLQLDVRTKNVLNDQQIHTIAQLLRYTDNDLRNMRNLGERSLARLRDALESVGLELGSAG